MARPLQCERVRDTLEFGVSIPSEGRPHLFQSPAVAHHVVGHEVVAAVGVVGDLLLESHVSLVFPLGLGWEGTAENHEVVALVNETVGLFPQSV